MPWLETNAANDDVETVASAWRTNAAGDDAETITRAWITNPAGDDVELFYSRLPVIQRFLASGLAPKPAGVVRLVAYVYHGGGGAAQHSNSGGGGGGGGGLRHFPGTCC